MADLVRHPVPSYRGNEPNPVGRHCGTKKLFVTPRFHFVHHSANKTFGNSNYGQLLTIWHRLFGTFTEPDTVPSDQSLGLGYPADNVKMLLGMKTGEPDLAGDDNAMRAAG